LLVVVVVVVDDDDDVVVVVVVVVAVALLHSGGVKLFVRQRLLAHLLIERAFKFLIAHFHATAKSEEAEDSPESGSLFVLIG
jgi:bifunctional DNase/RNase